MSQDVIELAGLTKRYGSHTAVDNLTLSIRMGEVFGLLGPNGAGKSTTILMMLGLTEPTSGSVTVCGLNSTRDPIRVKQKVGYLPEDVGFYEDYTGLENIFYTARLNGLSENEGKERALGLLNRVGLSDAIDKKVGKYSRGMRQRLGLADVLIKDPEVIILDEPTLGIDPTGVQDLLSLIVHLSQKDGLTVLLSSHHLHQVQEICDRVGLFVKGKLLAEGNVRTLSRTLADGRPFLFEAGVSLSEPPGTALQDSLCSINGVVSISESPGIFEIGCSKDVAPEIARVIVNSGAGLNHLRKKEYGLDEIYNHYFREN